MQIIYLGQSTFRFVTPESRVVLVDPWTASNPLCPPSQRDAGDVDLVLITHAHHDHLGDVLSIAGRRGPGIVAIAELGNWLSAHGVRNVHTMNLGGVLRLEGVEVIMTPAAHSSSLDDEPQVNVGVAAGFVLGFSDGVRIYHAGDTAAFAGMALIREVHRPGVAMLPIGDHHTMGPREAAAATRVLGVDRVIPMHYGVTPGSQGAPAAFRAELDAAGLGAVELLPMAPGERITVDA